MYRRDLTSTFLSTGCRYVRKCSTEFTSERVMSVRASCAELSHSELDIAILGQLMASVNTSSIVSMAACHKEDEHKKAFTSFSHQGNPVCIRMFWFLHGVGINRLKNLTRSFKENDLTPRVHGNTKRKPKHALSYSSTEFVVRFLFSYAEQHALLLPGRILWYSRTDIQLLPSSVSKRAVWRLYHVAAEEVDAVHAVAYSTFCLLWRTLTPSIVEMKPPSDLCWHCQQNSTAIMRTANSSEAEKSSTIDSALEHLRIVKQERTLYKSIYDECKESVRAHFVCDGEFSSPPLAACTPPNSKEIKVHYSFDYTQQVHYPSDPLQPGLIYFLTPRKCTVFGVNYEAYLGR